MADRRRWLVAAAVLCAGLTLAVLLTLPKTVPGYMDAYYHVTIGERIATGQGFTEPYVWNFLDAPEAIPHPSHLYWSPLPSLLVAGAIRLFGDGHWIAMLPFVLSTGLLSLGTYLLARRLGAGQFEAGASGILIVLAGFYVAYWTSPDSFAPFALAGSACLFLLAERHRGWTRTLAAGLAAGIGHLARPDGLLLLVTGILVLVWQGLAQRKNRRLLRESFAGLATLIAGYGLVMVPWYARNIIVAGSPLPGGGLQTLFLKGYDEVFAAVHLPNLQEFLAWGWGNILRSKLDAALSNLATLSGALMFVFAPLALWGWWKHRRDPLTPPLLVFGALLYGSLTFGFTFPGVRGSFFHSAGALLPFLFAAVFPGLRAAIAWFSARRRTWNRTQAYRFFSVTLAVLALAVSAVSYAETVFGIDGVNVAWSERNKAYPAAGRWLDAHGAAADRVLVNDPPAFYYLTGRECVAIPSDGPDALAFVRDRYQVRWLLLEVNHPRFLRPVYDGDEPLSGWVAREVFSDAGDVKAVLYEVETAGDGPQ